MAYKIKIISLCLFVFSLGIEYWDPFGFRNIFTITKFAGLLYAFFSFFDIKRNFAITKQNKLLVYSSLILWFWLTFVTLISSSLIGEDIFLFLGVLQVIILFWLVFNDVMNNPKVRNYVFLSFISGIVFISILLSFGIGIEDNKGDLINDIDNTRIYFMGMNPNRIGDLAAIAVLLVFSIVFSGKNSNKLRYLLLITIPSLLSIIGFSGSRGSFILVFLGLGVFFMLKKSKAFQKILFIIIGVVSGVLINNFMSNFDLLQKRLASSLNSGEAGGRIEIWEDVFNIIQENLIFGVGHGGYGFKMAQIYGVPKDSHNLFLFVWAVGGTIGLVILLIFYTKVFKNSWFNLRINGDATNMMILAAALLIVFKSGGAIDLKVIWLMLACITAVEYSSGSFRKKLNNI
ncbi:O-antigen ligase family protein [Aequorivita sp. Q41]|uniref:O-antigen ligase family protein n=1 Tax=Aequorivita sp. Q41 TaxID=3153300 RepID=UPI0032422AF1